MTGLSLEEVKECVKCASLNLEFALPRQTPEAKTLAAELDEAVAALVRPLVAVVGSGLSHSAEISVV